MGPCRVCQKPGSFGFQPPGLRKDRIAHWIAWGCYEHRAEVERMWREHLDAHRVDRAAGATQAGEQPGGNGDSVSDGSPDAKQGSLF
tara:strand:+ start:27588 stop:27848 length:261 start_codon:yes stop_codon:yes gene_type:complete